MYILHHWATIERVRRVAQAEIVPFAILGCGFLPRTFAAGSASSHVSKGARRGHPLAGDVHRGILCFPTQRKARWVWHPAKPLS
jgi:hypothetical protein